MSISKRTCLAIAVGTFVAGFASGGMMSAPVANAQASNRVFELRTYTAAPGKLEALHKRFRDHTVKLLSKHGMSHVGYWAPADAPLAENTLIYVLAHPKPRGREEELGRVQGRSGVDQGPRRVAKGRPAHHEGGVRVPEPDGLLTPQVVRRRG